MRSVIQRVKHASVTVDENVVSQIGHGLLIYLGVGKNDTTHDAEQTAKKVSLLRIFEDDAGKMNLNVADVKGAILLVPNFTLQGDCSKGRRPGFDQAADPEEANALFEYTVKRTREMGASVKKGIFGAHMHVESVNDGPINFVFDTK